MCLHKRAPSIGTYRFLNRSDPSEATRKTLKFLSCLMPLNHHAGFFFSWRCRMAVDRWAAGPSRAFAHAPRVSPSRFHHPTKGLS
jgi:hypothetical protein